MRLSVKLLLLLSLVSLTTFKSFGYVSNCYGPVNYSNYNMRTPMYYGPNYNTYGNMGSNYYYQQPQYNYDNSGLFWETLGGGLAGGALGYGLGSLFTDHQATRNLIGIVGAIAGGARSNYEERESQRINHMLANNYSYEVSYPSYDVSYSSTRNGGKIPGTSIQSQRVMSSSQAVIQ